MSERRFDSARLRYAATLLMAAILLSLTSAVGRFETLRPDVVAPILVFCALELELLPGLFVLSGVGYLADVFSGEPAGLYWGSSVLVFLLLRLFVFRVVGSRPMMVTAFVGVATALGLVTRLLMQAVLGGGPVPLSSFGGGLWSVALGAAVLGYPIYRLFRAVDERLRPREEHFA